MRVRQVDGQTDEQTELLWRARIKKAQKF